VTYFGWPSLCLRVRDLDASRAFYSRMGMEVVSEVDGKTVVLSYGTFRLALMTFLDENLLNFRGGNVRDIFADLKETFPNVEGEPEDYTPSRYDSDADGVCWATRDPDGNEIFFDTNEIEMGPEYLRKRSLEILLGAALERESIQADPKILATLRNQVIDPYAAGD
jgi:catechol 2,3-dioxygenase-like lactoylglutathione lyase family enzyme